jgi:hypothetical protein
MDPDDDPHPYELVADPFRSNIVVARDKETGDVVWEKTFASMPVTLFRVHHLRNSATVVQVTRFLLEDDSQAHVSKLLLTGGGEWAGAIAAGKPDSVPLISDGRNNKISKLLIGMAPLVVPVKPPEDGSEDPVEEPDLSGYERCAWQVEGPTVLRVSSSLLLLVFMCSVGVIVVVRAMRRRAVLLASIKPEGSKPKPRKKSLKRLSSRYDGQWVVDWLALILGAQYIGPFCSGDGCGGNAKVHSHRSHKRVRSPSRTSLAQPAGPPPKAQLKIVVKERVLGYGSGGTVVYEGSLEGRRIAVKRMLKVIRCRSWSRPMLVHSGHRDICPPPPTPI